MAIAGKPWLFAAAIAGEPRKWFRRYVLALVGGVALAVIGMVLLDDKQVGATIGAGFGLAYGMLRDGKM